MDNDDGKVDIIWDLMLPIGMGTFMFIPLLVCNYTGNTTWDGVYIFSVFSAFFGFVVMLSVLKGYWLFKQLHAVLSIPIILMLTLKKPIFIIGGIFIGYIVISMCITGGIILLIQYGFGLEFSHYSFHYLLFTFSAIISTTFGDRLLKLYHWLNNRDEEGIVEASLRLVNQEKISYLLYCLYFLVLIAFNARELDSYSFFRDEDLSTATLQSFATFLAYDQVLLNWRKVFKKQEN